ncbi:response regulator transcription factor [Poseidonocella sp. HB161398]|uniref:response regulator transcription factor n=1 Tax=Poseidonocella sp. HB161398 TaxID=2320855 RepID=UPI00110879F9|nr:response regulator [Poseidonocella sp. HB161398]
MGRHVLLIEDEPNITEAMRFILARDGWTVSSHADGATAVNAVSRAKPDVVVLDVMLPGRSGYDILRDLRANPDTEALPVMMLTARGQVRDRERAESFGVSHFMTKPFSNREVLDTLNSLLGP